MRKVFALLLVVAAALCSEAQGRRENRFPAARQNGSAYYLSMKPLANNLVQFTATLKPLQRIAGAPTPFYTYFWEFGDGTFSDATKEGDALKEMKGIDTLTIRYTKLENLEFMDADLHIKTFVYKDLKLPAAGKKISSKAKRMKQTKFLYEQ